MFEDYKSFGLAIEPTEEQKEFVSKLNMILNKVGCSFEFWEFQPEDGDKVLHSLRITINNETANQSRTRGAGRKKTFLQDEHGNFVLAKDVREQLKTQSADEVAAGYGISRATLFRRLKETEFDDDWV